jgi:hypothetical protein
MGLAAAWREHGRVAGDGVIAGSMSVGMGRIVARGLPVPNDGVVTIDETRLACATDHIVLPVSHSAMLLSKQVARQTAAFLNNGRFAAAS